MPKIPSLLAFGKHCHACGTWIQRRALRKDAVCDFCKSKVFARNRMEVQLCSRCVECDNIILDNFNYCECCGLETPRQLRLTKAAKLSNLFTKCEGTQQKSTVDKSEEFEELQVDDDELRRLEESALNNNASEDEEKKNSLQLDDDDESTKASSNGSTQEG